MNKRLYERGEENHAKDCMVTFVENIKRRNQYYFNQGQELREQLLGLPKWRWIRRLRLGHQIKQADLAHCLLQVAVDDALWYRNQIGTRSRSWLIESLGEFVRWLKCANNGKVMLLMDKVGPVEGAILYLRGAIQHP